MKLLIILVLVIDVGMERLGCDYASERKGDAVVAAPWAGDQAHSTDALLVSVDRAVMSKSACRVF